MATSACLGAAALVITIMRPSIALYQTAGIVRTVRELDDWSAPIRAYVSAPPTNLLHRLVGWPLATDATEMILFPGLTITLLAALALARRPDRERLFWIIVAAGALTLSFGAGLRLERGGEPLPAPLPYLTLYAHVPGFGGRRVPSRWGLLVMLALSMLAALALPRLLARVGRAGNRCSASSSS